MTGRVPPVPTAKVYKLNKESFISAAALYKRLVDIQAGSAEPWWAKFEVVIVQNEKGEEEVKLICKLCDKQLAASNPSQSAKNHFGSDDKPGSAA